MPSLRERPAQAPAGSGPMGRTPAQFDPSKRLSRRIFLRRSDFFAASRQQAEESPTPLPAWTCAIFADACLIEAGTKWRTNVKRRKALRGNDLRRWASKMYQYLLTYVKIWDMMLETAWRQATSGGGKQSDAKSERKMRERNMKAERSDLRLRDRPLPRPSSSFPPFSFLHVSVSHISAENHPQDVSLIAF